VTGAAGADVAIAAADVALFTNDLRCLPHVVRLGRLVRAKVAQNVALAVITKVGGWTWNALTREDLDMLNNHVNSGVLATRSLPFVLSWHHAAPWTDTRNMTA
jgi:cation transport ATPase